MAAKAEDPIAALLKVAQKKYNLTVGPMDAVAEGIRFITTGNLAIDFAIGGGIPLGRTIEAFGPPSCGKTTTALQTAAALQKIILAGGDEELGVKADDHILYLDYEQAMDKVYAASLGLDTDHPSFLFTQPDTLEDGANFILDAVKTGRIRLVIVDSVAAMNPSAKAEAEIGKSLPAVQAKLLKDFGMNLNSALANHGASVFFLNHEIDVMDMGARRPGMPAPTTTSGGKATKYFASVRIQYRMVRQNKAEATDPLTQEKIQQVVSTDVRVKVVKNKVAPPFREALVRVRFGRGFDQFWTALQILLGNKKIRYESGRYYFHEIADEGFAPDWMPRLATGTNRPYIHGEANVFAAGDANPEWRDGLIALAKSVVEENAAALETVVPLREASVEEETESLELDAMLGDLPSAAGNRVEI